MALLPSLGDGRFIAHQKGLLKNSPKLGEFPEARVFLLKDLSGKLETKGPPGLLFLVELPVLPQIGAFLRRKACGLAFFRNELLCLGIAKRLEGDALKDVKKRAPMSMGTRQEVKRLLTGEHQYQAEVRCRAQGAQPLVKLTGEFGVAANAIEFVDAENRDQFVRDELAQTLLETNQAFMGEW